MYLKEVTMKNYGPIDNIEYTLPFDQNKNPIPVIIIGKNGVGKTLVLSNILHSLIEMKRTFYSNLREVSENKYYRVGSKSYIRTGKNEAYEKITFDNSSYYVDLMINDYELFKQQYDATIYSDINVEDERVIQSGFFNYTKKPDINIFDNHIFLYFPVERYYIPTWENAANEKLTFKTNDTNFLGQSKNSIVKYNLLDDIESWILDVIIDKMLYEEEQVPILGTNIDHKSYRIRYSGKNTDIQTAINSILSIIFPDKYTSVRIGISNKKQRQIVVIGINPDGTEEEFIPKFSNFSSGEMMIFGIFATIIKEYDEISGNTNINFDSITGIVLIDEIDIHLHSDLLKDALPGLIKLFPKIQFIITSHSPFFLIGMQESFNSKCQFLSLPTGIIMENIENFDEIKRCYSIIDDNYNNVLKTIEDYNSEFKDISKPFIITEGQTDWKHLKNALKKLQSIENIYGLDIKFLEYNYDMGDSKLENLLKNLAKIPHPNKIIGVFDNDSDIGAKYLSPVDLGNNVYACCIKDVHNYNCGISIELLYTREDLKKCDVNGRRLFLSDEFTELACRLKSDSSIVCHNQTLKDAKKRKLVKIVDCQVFDIEENSLALSKERFADNILNDLEPFSDLSVDGFKEIFQTIQRILNYSDEVLTVPGSAAEPGHII